MKLIKGSKKLIFIFKAFYAYQAYALFKHFSYLDHAESVENYYLLYSCFALSLLAIFFTRNQILRILTAIAIVFFVIKFITISTAPHARHLLSYISFFLIFISNKKKHSKAQELEDLLAFWSIQFVILCSYSFSGFYKLIHSFDKTQGLVGYFSPHALTRIIAAWKFSHGLINSLFIDFLIEHHRLSQILGISLVFIEFFAVFALVNPKLAKIWGLLLIIMHISTWLIMGILFQANIVSCFLFLVMNPLQYSSFSQLKPCPRIQKRKGTKCIFSPLI